jgi:hypothetical protein
MRRYCLFCGESNFAVRTLHKHTHCTTCIKYNIEVSYVFYYSNNTAILSTYTIHPIYTLDFYYVDVVGGTYATYLNNNFKDHEVFDPHAIYTDLKLLHLFS